MWNGSEGMRISAPVLEEACKKMIEIILRCLPQAIRGSLYTVGPIPELRVVRLASGHREGKSDEIQWDGLTRSEYTFPGKVWDDYRDRPGRTLEAMAWCVETQKSWTADDPEHNGRSMRKQLEGKAGEDYHHMEPVVIKKADLWNVMPPPDAYPKNSLGKPIWQDTPNATVAVIKIHFSPGGIRRGDSATRVIRELSQSLGTQMLSLHAREVALEAHRKLTEERQEVCDALAHEFRNLVPRIGFAYRAINNEIAYLRESWEDLVSRHSSTQPHKSGILQQLDRVLQQVRSKYSDYVLTNEILKLSDYQKQLSESCLLPGQNETWLKEKIRPLWMSILEKTELPLAEKRRIENLLDRLKKSFYLGLNNELSDRIGAVPEEIKKEWIDLSYREINGKTNGLIQEYIDLLNSIDLDLPHKRHSLRNFIYLKELVELIPEIEGKLNSRLESFKNSDHRVRRIRRSTNAKGALCSRSTAFDEHCV
jgi:hypothetical protein